MAGHELTESLAGEQSRRSLMKKAAVAGGALWILPTINSFTSSAAANSPRACPATSALTLTSTLPGVWQTPASHNFTCVGGAVSPVTDAVIVYESSGVGSNEQINMNSLDWGAGAVSGTRGTIRQLGTGALCSYYIWRDPGVPVVNTFAGTITPPAGWRVAAVAWNRFAGVGGLANTTTWRGPFSYDAAEHPLEASDSITLAAAGASVTFSLPTNTGCDPLRVFLEHLS